MFTNHINLWGTRYRRTWPLLAPREVWTCSWGKEGSREPAPGCWGYLHVERLLQLLAGHQVLKGAEQFVMPIMVSLVHAVARRVKGTICSQAEVCRAPMWPIHVHGHHDGIHARGRTSRVMWRLVGWEGAKTYAPQTSLAQRMGKMQKEVLSDMEVKTCRKGHYRWNEVPPTAEDGLQRNVVNSL